MLAILLLLLFVLGIFNLDGVTDDDGTIFVKRISFSSDAAAMIHQIQISQYRISQGSSSRGWKRLGEMSDVM